MTRLILKARTALALGLLNIFRAAVYRQGVKLGGNPVRRLRAAVPQGPFFRPAKSGISVVALAVEGWRDSARLFSHLPMSLVNQSLDWLANPLNGQRVAKPERNWWQIPDFDPKVGDIKLIWELSRMDWVLAFAQRARQADAEALGQLNDWLADWCRHNSPYQGPNWKCGQEASIRVMHLAIGALILGQVREPEQALRDLICLHLRRIAPTVQYAMAQDNNHGTSEAAALFMGGSWLVVLGVAEGERWQRIGRRWLEDRAERLVGAYGSFSQYSLNYHRVMLDTFCMAEVWRRHLDLPVFSLRWKARALAAAQWLRHMINPMNGDGPNIGANDGARLLQLTRTSYRDYRPSVQLAMALFCEQRAYMNEGPWNDALHWLGVAVPKTVAPEPGSLQADDGGFTMLRRGEAMAMLRYPRFRFRPSQSDALHLDFWLGGENLLRDAGTYSYNTEAQWLNYFGGTASHNTVQFDERDQMPRISRFLLGDWLKTKGLQPLHDDGQMVRFGAGYTDGQGASHHRSLALGQQHLTVMDKVGGFGRSAVLRWRLAPGLWTVKQADGEVQVCSPDYLGVVLTVRASSIPQRCELLQGWESRHYLEKTPLQVLEFEVTSACTITTEVVWPE